MARPVTPIPVGRIRRGAKVGGLLGLETARAYATKAANVARSDEDRKSRQRASPTRGGRARRRGARADEGRRDEGRSDGLADGFRPLPTDELEEFQARACRAPRLRAAGPFKDMQKVIEHELGERISDLFAEFDPEAAAAASIGQVYQGAAARRSESRRQGAVPARRRGGARRSAEPRAADARGEAVRARAGCRGDGARDTGADHRGARLRARGRRLSACSPAAGADTRSSSFPRSSPISPASACSSPNGWMASTSSS